eukprot:2149464-Pleurochrysis_carterae.AAC.1
MLPRARQRTSTYPRQYPLKYPRTSGYEQVQHANPQARPACAWPTCEQAQAGHAQAGAPGPGQAWNDWRERLGGLHA